jgi:hypothetical protein
MEQPDGYIARKGGFGMETQEGPLRTGQAGRTWNEELNAHMEGEGFTATTKDPAMYVKSSMLRLEAAHIFPTLVSFNTRDSIVFGTPV